MKQIDIELDVLIAEANAKRKNQQKQAPGDSIKTKQVNA